MWIERSYDIRAECGALIIPDLEWRLDVTLDWDDAGEPYVSVDAVYARDWRALDKDVWVSLFESDDALFQKLGARVAGMAEKDDSVLDNLLEDAGASYRSLGPNDPDGYWRRAS